MRLTIALMFVLMAAPANAAVVASFQNASNKVLQGTVWDASPSFPAWQLEQQNSNDPKIVSIGQFSINFLNGSPSSIVVPGQSIPSGVITQQGSITTSVKFFGHGPNQVSMTIPFSTTAGSGTAPASLGIEMIDAAPVISQVQADQFVNVGEPYTFSVTATDPGLDPLSYSWDLNGDGNYNDSHSASGQSSFSQPGNHTVAVKVFDDWPVPLSATDSFVIHVYPDGDFNHDGRVDARDYVVWRATDGSSDGYAKWRSNFGTTVSLGSATSVPEPSATATIIMAIIALATTQRELRPKQFLIRSER